MCSVIARYRSHVSTIAFILSGKLILEPLYIDFEFVGDYLPGSRRIIFGIMPRPWIGPSMRQIFGYTELFRYKSPVLFESFEFPDEIGKHVAVRIDEPIQLIPVRRRVNTSGAAVFDPIYEIVKAHLTSELQSFGAPV